MKRNLKNIPKEKSGFHVHNNDYVHYVHFLVAVDALNVGWISTRK